MTLTTQLQELDAAKAKVAELEAKIATERQQALAALPAQFGFADVASFVAAVRATVPGKRGKITDDVKAEVSKLLAAGKTGAEIAKAMGISMPSVQLIKKQLGLVKARQKKQG